MKALQGPRQRKVVGATMLSGLVIGLFGAEATFACIAMRSGVTSKADTRVVLFSTLRYSNGHHNSCMIGTMQVLV